MHAAVFGEPALVADGAGIGGRSRSIRIFRPSEECAVVGRGRRLSRTARGLRVRSDETSAVPAEPCVALRLAREAVEFELAVERGAADAEFRRGVRYASAAPAQGLDHEDPLPVFELERAGLGDE